MLALPEATLFGRHQGPTSLRFYLELGFLLIATSLLLVTGVALAVHLSRRRRDA
jgi:hypothetical protein